MHGTFAPLNPARRHALPHVGTTCAIRWRRHSSVSTSTSACRLPHTLQVQIVPTGRPVCSDTLASTGGNPQ